jgi:hypothetical protein
MLETFPERVHGNGSLNWRKLVSVALIVIGILIVAPMVALGVFFLSVQAALGGAFILLLGAVSGVGVAPIIAGLLAYKNRILT